MILTPALKRIAPVAGVVVALTVAVPAWSKTQIGILNCDTSIGIGKILMRKQTMTCVFTHSNGKTENYTGTVREYGLEVGMVKEGHLAWAVVAGTPMKGTGLLAGKYAGATASVAAGLGLGADVLVGSTGDTLALQPVAVEGLSGISLSAGVEQLELVAAP
jgi:acyl CoA:acetate/3-ketoacid CoA transferase alpha subunit